LNFEPNPVDLDIPVKFNGDYY